MTLAPFFRKLNARPVVAGFVAGVTASACGALAGATWVLGRRAIVDVTTLAIFAAMLLALRFLKKIPEPVPFLTAGLIGLVARGIQPHP